MSYIKCKKPITLKRSFEVGGTPVYNILTDKNLPGVNFQIISNINRNEEDKFYLESILLKRPNELARTTITIRENKDSRLEKNTCDWTDVVRLKQDLLISYLNRRDGVDIEYEIIWHGFVEELPTFNLYRNMKCLHATSALSDFVINIDDEEIPIHKVIFAAQSPVFSAMFETDMIESRVNKIIIKDITIYIMKKVIEFLYTGIIDAEMDVSVTFAVLSVAIKYQIMNLKDLCIGIISKDLAMSNVLQVVEKSSLYEIPQLVEQAMDLMIEYRDEIIELEDWENFLCMNPALCVQYIRRLVKLSC